MATPKLSDKMIKCIEKDIAAGLSTRDISRARGVSTGTVSNVRSGLVSADVQKLAMQRQLQQATSKCRDAMAWAQELQSELDVMRMYKDLADICVPVGFNVRPSAKKHEAVPCMVWSDWHSEEVVDKASMNGLNEYNPTIFQERLSRLMSCTASIMRIYRGNSDIHTAVIALLGDFITGWIHDDNISSNAQTPPEAIVTVLNSLIGAVDFLLAEFPDINFIVVEAPGNHSRITNKLPSKNTPKKNYEWMLWQLLARWYTEKINSGTLAEDRIKFCAPDGDMNWLTIMGRPTRWTHGTQIRYLGGVGGPTVSLLKAIKAWDTGQKAALTVLGHLHTPLTDMRTYAMNGSLIGYNTFARDFVKAEFTLASQLMFLLHQRYWLTGMYNIQVQHPPKRKVW